MLVVPRCLGECNERQWRDAECRRPWPAGAWREAELRGRLQILEKYTHGELPAASKLSSPLREPLIAFFCKHPHATVAYFLTDQRLFSERQDYFWLLHDLSLHPKGGCLLDALCASTDLWHPILDLAIADLTADAAAPCPERYFGILHLMAAVATARPQWLSQRPDLWRKVNVFWQHPGLRARLGALQRHGVRERAEAALLARLVLSYVHENAGELPRVLDLFAVFEQPVRRRPRCARFQCRDHGCGGWALAGWLLPQLTPTALRRCDCAVPCTALALGARGRAPAGLE